MRIHETLSLPLDPMAVARMYADPQYAQVRADVLHAEGATAAVDGDPTGAFTVTTELRMPTDQVPDMVRRFVGQTVTVREVQTWQAPDAEGVRSGTIRFDVVGAPASMIGTTALSRVGENGSDLVIDGDLVAKVPLVGRKIEQAAVPYVSDVLTREQTSAGRYAAGH